MPLCWRRQALLLSITARKVSDMHSNNTVRKKHHIMRRRWKLNSSCRLIRYMLVGVCARSRRSTYSARSESTWTTRRYETSFYRTPSHCSTNLPTSECVRCTLQGYSYYVEGVGGLKLNSIKYNLVITKITAQHHTKACKLTYVFLFTIFQQIRFCLCVFNLKMRQNVFTDGHCPDPLRCWQRIVDLGRIIRTETWRHGRIGERGSERDDGSEEGGERLGKGKGVEVSRQS